MDSTVTASCEEFFSDPGWVGAQRPELSSQSAVLLAPALPGAWAMMPTTRRGIGSPWWALPNPGLTATPMTLPSVAPSARATGAEIATGIASPGENAPGSSPETTFTPERFSGVSMAIWSRRSPVVATPPKVAMLVAGPMTVVVVPAVTSLMAGGRPCSIDAARSATPVGASGFAAGPRPVARLDSPMGTLMTGSAREPAVATACRAPRSNVSASI